jgi:DNA-directed RNA polymerase specialized sigma24 family protein
MARIEWIEMRLLNWARWRLMEGSGPLGYAGVNLTDPTAIVQRNPYADAPVPTNAIEAGETEDGIRQLEPDLAKAVQAWYLRTDGLRGALKQTGVSESTLHQRIDRAHRRLAEWLNDRQERARQERERVAALQAASRPRAGGFTP